VVGGGFDPAGQWADYLITPELGAQRGGNLFHSFLRFGIASGETASFTGPDPIEGPQSVSHVISRVTGGTRSEIDGTLRSTIPGADVWLLNPSGVVFGEGAQLDVRGSFHAGTADYIDFGEGGLERF
jgi:filamentous hemagglutinin family protein